MCLHNNYSKEEWTFVHKKINKKNKQTNEKNKQKCMNMSPTSKIKHKGCESAGSLVS